MRAGLLTREVEWRSPTGGAVRVRTTRLVSFTQRSVAAIRFEVEPLEAHMRVVVQSELVANEPVPVMTKDPRAAAALAAPLVAEEHSTYGMRAVLVHITRRSRLRMAAGMDHAIEGPEGWVYAAESRDDLGRITITADIEPGQPLKVDKLLAYGWSSVRSLPSVRDQVDAALAAARKSGFDGIAKEQRHYLDEFWDRADVELEGDMELQQAVRFSIFHSMQAGARAEQRAIPAKGLTGPGYDGHSFWDSESFVLPLLTYTVPDAAADALRWRWSTLDLAVERAATLHLEGAAFPWRTIRGQECSGYWPAGTAAFHINAGIAAAVIRYVQATGDEDFERTVGLELLVPTARLWRSLGHHDADGSFHIDGVTGPDEYTAIVDDNVYTNLMAQWNLRAAAEWCARHRDEAEALGVDVEEEASWRDAATAMAIPYDDALDVHPQNEDFTRKALWNFNLTRDDQYPLLLHFPYFDLYRRQVVKQPDLVLAMQVRGDAFTPNQKARNFAYYEAITVRDSSLSACTQAVMAAEVGPPRPRLRLLRRGRAGRHRRPQGEHQGRAAHRLAGGGLERRRQRLRRDARQRGAALLRPPPASRAHAALVPDVVAGPAAVRRGRGLRGQVHADRGRHARHHPLRGAGHDPGGRAAGHQGAARAPAARASPAARPGARAAPAAGALARVPAHAQGTHHRLLRPRVARRDARPGPVHPRRDGDLRSLELRGPRSRRRDPARADRARLPARPGGAADGQGHRPEPGPGGDLHAADLPARDARRHA